MEKVRIGNDIQVKYTVLRDGQPESFAGATNIAVEVRNEAYGKVIPSTFSIVDNVVNVVLDAKDCVLCGKHRVTLSYNRGNDITIDALAFELVQFTSQTGGTEIVGVEIVTVNISGDIGIAIPDNNKIDLDGLNSNIDKLHFNPDTLVQLAEIGDVRYSTESRTLEVKVSDTVSIQLGQEMQTRVKNNAGVQINNGQLVYIDSASGANPLAKIASTTDANIAQRTFGMATENIASNGFGAITTEGLVRDIDTSAFAEGAMLWLGVNGAVTNIEPVAPTPKISVGMVLRSNVNSGVIYVKIRAIARNQKLSDVYAPTMTGGDVLRWNSTTLRFETFNVTTALAGKADLVGGKIPTSQLPAYVDDVLEYANLAAFPATGETGKIYVALDTNLTYRWSGTAYVEISKSLALGETSDTAYRGDRGKTAYDHSQATGNVHGTTASQIPNTPAGTIAATTVQGAINELAGDIVQVETNLNTYNVTVSVPLTAGSYYNKTTARSAVPTVSRKIGLVITYATADKVWYTEKYIGTTVSGWTTESKWEQVPDASQIAQVRADLNALNEIVLADTNIFTGISKTGVGNLGIRLDGNVDVNNKYIKLDLRGKTFKLKVFTNELQPQYQILGMNSDGWSDGTYIGGNYLFGIEYEINLDLSKYGIIIYTVGITSSTVRTAEIRVEGNKYGLIHKVEDNTYRITTLEENQINGSDFIKVVPQLLTEEQKSTARNNIDAADYTMIEKTEEVLHYESLSMLGVYKKSYFSKPYLLGTVLKSFSSSTVDTFYLVKDNNALDTSLLIRSTDLPMPIPNNCIGIASNKSGNIDITFSTLEKINQIEKIRADFDTYVSESIKLNLYGKTIGVFGDSILHMKYGEAGNDKSVADWINYITGANVINFATGGSTLKQRTFPTDSPTSANEAFANLDIINMVKALVSGDYTKQIASKNYALTHPEKTDLNGQIDSIDRLIASSIEDFDAVLILAGTNDYRNGGATLQNEPLNDMSYTGEAIKEIVSQIMTYQKNISLYWATPIVRYCDPYNFDEWKDYNVDDLVMYNGQRYKFTSQHLKGAWIGTDVVPITALEMRTDFSWGDNFVNSGGITLKEFAKRLKNIMIGYKIPICDMYNELGWNQYNFSKFLLTSDGTHPYYGIEILAKKLISFIQSNRIF